MVCVMMRQFSFLWCSLVTLSIGCSEGPTASAPDASAGPDAAPIARIDRAYLVSSLQLPAMADAVQAAAFDYDGSGRATNRLGGLITVLLDLLEGVPVQDTIDSSYADGDVMFVMALNSGDLAEFDPAVTVQWGHTENLAEAPSLANRELFAVVGDSYVVDANALEGAGIEDVSVSIALKLLPDEPPTIMSGGFVHLRGSVDEEGFSFALGTVTTVEALHAELYPGIARVMTHALQIESPRAIQIAGLFDTNADGEVTVQELVESDQLATLVAPDVDLDGDGTPEHVSQGVMLHGVRNQNLE